VRVCVRAFVINLVVWPRCWR